MLKFVKDNWFIIVVLIVSVIMLNNTLENYANKYEHDIYSLILDDDAQRPSLIDEHIYYKYDLERLRDLRPGISSLKCEDKPIYSSGCQNNYTNSVPRARPLYPRQVNTGVYKVGYHTKKCGKSGKNVREGFESHDSTCTGEECFCD